MAKFLVTGGCGFIGSHLVDDLLRDGHDVVVLDDLSTGHRSNLDPRARLVAGDIRDEAAVAEAMAGVAGCFHLAAIASVVRSIEDWSGTHAVNLSGTVRILDRARQAGAPVVYASSAAVYGNLDTMPLTEDMPARPLTAYGADKLGCELHAAVAWSQFGLPTTGLRFFNVYGPRQDPKSPYSGVISIFADRTRNGQSVTVHGDGGQERDFIEVSDVVRHLRRAFDTSAEGARVFNVCTGRATTVRRLAELVAAANDKEPRIESGPPRPGDIRRSLGSPARAVAALGIEAAVRIEDGLRRLAESL